MPSLLPNPTIVLIASGLINAGLQSAQAQTTQAPIVNSVKQTAAGGANSGREGSDRILRRRPSENRGLVGLVVAERGNDPCELTTTFRGLANNSIFQGTGAFRDCGNNNQAGTNQSRRTILLPSGFFATGVRVCLNSNRTKVKGVQLIGRHASCLNFNVPQLQANPSCLRFEHMERTNCAGSDSGLPDGDWEAAAGCPLNHVAIGVQLGTRSGGGNRRMLDGIGLKCARVAP